MSKVEFADSKRVLILSLIVFITGELLIFVFFGLILFPEGNLVNKFIWAVGFCGFGMGSAVGVLINLCVINKSYGFIAILKTVIISFIVIGSCNILCLKLDHHFNYFGGVESPRLFLWNGFIGAILGGIIIGYLLFTPKGTRLLKKIKL